jgi:hypothetical protein
LVDLRGKSVQGFETDGDLGREIGDRVATILDKRVMEAEGVESEVCKSKIHVFLFLQSIVCYYIKMTVMTYKRIKNRFNGRKEGAGTKKN